MDMPDDLRIVDTTTKKKLRYKWSPLKIIALVVLILGIVLAIVGLIFYSQSGKSSDIYGAAWVWTVIIIALLLLFLSGFLLAFS